MVQHVTMNDSEWERVIQRVIMNDNKWQVVVQQMKTNASECQQVKESDLYLRMKQIIQRITTIYLAIYNIYNFGSWWQIFSI